MKGALPATLATVLGTVCLAAAADARGHALCAFGDSSEGGCRRGCLVPTALNYDSRASIHNSSCKYHRPQPGCTDRKKLGFNPLATVDDGSCRPLVLGCTHVLAVNYLDNATVDDGSCRYNRAGCMQRDAVNYDAMATRDDGSCHAAQVGCTSPLARNFDPSARSDSGNCVYDSREGCMDSRALNFQPHATMPGGSACVLPTIGCMVRFALNYMSRCCFCTNPSHISMLVSSLAFESRGFARATRHGRGTCVFPPPSAAERHRGCMVRAASNFDKVAEVDDGSCTFGTHRTAAASVLIHRPPLVGCTDSAAVNYNVRAAVDDGTCRLAVALLPKAGRCNDLLASNYGAAARCVYAVRGCTDTSALNFNPIARLDDGSCRAPRRGCMSKFASGYDPSANLHISSVCGVYRHVGCTLSTAINFESKAHVDDGTCVGRREGCTDRQASNYDPMSTVNTAGACTYAKRGCTSRRALNTHPRATVDDGSCRFAGCKLVHASNYQPEAHVTDNTLCVFHTPRGCTDVHAVNFDPLAKRDDGSCAQLGCTQSRDAGNFNSKATVDDGSCELAPPWHARTGGCTNAHARNYASGASYDDGSCELKSRGCINPLAVNFDSDAEVDAGNCVLVGCTKEGAVNYDSSATVDIGSCHTLPAVPRSMPVSLAAACTDVVRRALLSVKPDEITQELVSLDELLLKAAPALNMSADIAASAAESCMLATAKWLPAKRLADGVVIASPASSRRRLQSCNSGLSAINSLSTSNASAVSCGCMNDRAENYDSEASIEDGGCVILGCTDSEALNYDSEATNNTGCTYNVYGCIAPTAKNYDSTATVEFDPSTCAFVVEGTRTIEPATPLGNMLCLLMPCICTLIL